MKPTRPILRYHGGKWEIAKWIISHFPPHRVYVEPYGGAASVLMQKERSWAEVYNDLDGDIVNLFKALREFPKELHDSVLATPFARDEYVAAFQESRGLVESARRALIRSHMGHAGIATHGRASGFRSACVNSGSHPASQWAGFPRVFQQIIDRWRGVVIENRDAIEVIRQQDDPQTLFYLDPPYVTSSRDAGRDYRHEMTDADHEALACTLSSISGMVVLSGYSTGLYERLYAGWETDSCEVISEKAKSRTELLWMNQAAINGLRQGVLFGVG